MAKTIVGRCREVEQWIGQTWERPPQTGSARQEALGILSLSTEPACIEEEGWTS